ncbi:carboxymuconolactone decarboxylase family protein [Thalassoporum mexicanum]|uniref:carboxymuconolactone decarboxylase family protein n=1 Tax=Thalassoporum mexicanum TaxID=3457544 RepID=UPI0039B6F196
MLESTGIKEDLAKLDSEFGSLFYRLAVQVWGLPIISVKDKALIAIAIDIAHQDKAAGEVDPFIAHVKIASQNGATRAEIKEVITFTCVYAGFNKGVSFFAKLQSLQDSDLQ